MSEARRRHARGPVRQDGHDLPRRLRPLDGRRPGAAVPGRRAPAAAAGRLGRGPGHPGPVGLRGPRLPPGPELAVGRGGAVGGHRRLPLGAPLAAPGPPGHRPGGAGRRRPPAGRHGGGRRQRRPLAAAGRNGRAAGRGRAPRVPDVTVPAPVGARGMVGPSGCPRSRLRCRLGRPARQARQRTDMTPDSAPRHAADSHDVIQVRGARENNLADISLDIPKRRLTVFTGVSGSGKSSLVFGTIAAESRRLINETYTAFVQGFMPNLGRPDVDALHNLSAAIIVDQERMGANARSTVGTATDAHTLLRIVFSRLGQPHIGPSTAFSFNVPSVRGQGAITIERGAGETERRSFSVAGGMCPRCEGMGSVTDIDLTQLYDEGKSLAEGAITIPGYTADGWMVRIFTESGFLDPDKPIRDYTETELHDFLHREPTKVKVNNINLTYEGLIPRVQKSFLSKDPEALRPHLRAFVDRAVTFTACPECGGSRLNEAARSSRIDGINIADACAMQISDLAEWVRGLDEPSVAPLLATLRHTLDSFVEIGLGYLSLDRPSGTLSGGEAQRTKMIRHLGSSLTDVTYLFDEPTIGLHPHNIERMNNLLLQLRDKGNTVLVVEHKP